MPQVLYYRATVDNFTIIILFNGNLCTAGIMNTIE